MKDRNWIENTFMDAYETLRIFLYIVDLNYLLWILFQQNECFEIPIRAICKLCLLGFHLMLTELCDSKINAAENS